MRPVFKSQHKADLDAAQRRHYWSLSPAQRVALAVRLNAQARASYAANPANPPLPDFHGVIKSRTPISWPERLAAIAARSPNTAPET